MKLHSCAEFWMRPQKFWWAVKIWLIQRKIRAALRPHFRAAGREALLMRGLSLLVSQQLPSLNTGSLSQGSPGRVHRAVHRVLKIIPERWRRAVLLRVGPLLLRLLLRRLLTDL